MGKWAKQERIYIQICTLTKIFLIRKTFGSGALSGIMLLVRIVEIIILILILGQARLSKG